MTQIGGASNSITYIGTPHYSNQIWCVDFSAPGVLWTNIRTFVHEFGHVWQCCYGTQPVIGFLENLYNFGISDGNQYAQYTYDYSLRTSNDFNDYNIEQQASIIADYWAVKNGHSAQHCTNPASPKLSDYSGLINQVQAAHLLHQHEDPR